MAPRADAGRGRPCGPKRDGRDRIAVFDGPALQRRPPVRTGGPGCPVRSSGNSSHWTTSRWWCPSPDSRVSGVGRAGGGGPADGEQLGGRVHPARRADRLIVPLGLHLLHRACSVRGRERTPTHPRVRAGIERRRGGSCASPAPSSGSPACSSGPAGRRTGSWS
ncbi:hypothetical protein HBB16_07280 [Pseudonocardia sp. MCCB 268]|nr:hypothetical protein [Pseudonocardia cytotoxica]